MSDTKTQTQSVSPAASNTTEWLGDDNIKKILLRLEETNDCSWTELCILTVREIVKPLQEEIERLKVDRNRIGMTERRKYLPVIERLKSITPSEANDSRNASNDQAHLPPDSGVAAADESNRKE